jgi:hypothetical protein
MRALLDPLLSTDPTRSVSGMLDHVHGPAGFSRALELLCALQPCIESRALMQSLLGADGGDWSRAPPAYRHDNGYFKLPLLRSAASGAVLRLNIWAPGLMNMENVHDHRWDYASHLLCGALNEAQYCAGRDGGLRHWFQYNPRGQSGSYELVRRGELSLRMLQQERLVRGRYYVRPQALMHAVAPDPGALTASLQITFNPIASFSNVFALEDLGRSSAWIPSPPVTDGQRAAVLRGLDAALAGG